MLTSKRDDIQGLRAFAVVSVFIFHLNANYLPGGFVGVDIFLVISGYLISKIIIEKKKAGKFSFLDFYISRVRRIVPAYFLLLIVTCAASALIFTYSNFAFFKNSLLSAALFNSNRFFANSGDYFAPSSHLWPLLHTWTLAVEMKAYFILPFFLIFLNVRMIRILTPVIIVLLTIYSHKLSISSTDHQKAYYSTLLRVPEFMLGTALAAFSQEIAMLTQRRFLKEGLGIAGLALLFTSVFMISEDSPYPGITVIAPCVGAALLIISAESKINWILSTKPLATIGEYSYSLYLWHWPVFAILRYCSGQIIFSPALMPFAVLTAVALSTASYHLVEKPFREVGTRRLVMTLPAILGLAFSLFHFSSKINASIKEPNVSGIQSLDTRCHNKIVGNCLKGTLSSTKRYLLLGDSHALFLNPFFNYIGSKNGFQVTSITNDACLTIPGTGFKYSGPFSKTCKRQIQAVEKIIDNYDLIIVAGRWEKRTYENKDLARDIEKLIARLNKRNTPAVFMSDIPMLSMDVSRYARISQLGLPAKIHITQENSISNTKIKKLISHYENVSFLDISDSAAFKTAPYHEGKIMYYNDTHLNSFGSEVYAKHSEAQVVDHFKKIGAL